MSAPDRKARLDRRSGRLSVRRQCALMGLTRSGVYREPASTREDDRETARRIDELYTERPFYGSRRIAFELKANRKRVQRLMRKMGIAALGPKPNLSKPAPGHRIYPYLLRNLSIERPNQVWAADITYVPIGDGFLYLVAIMDWASRAVLAWRLSNTMDTSFCIAALEEALARFGKPEIFNTDQGSQFTSAAFTGSLANADIAISMDGRGRFLDNIFIERLWRSLKHEDVYLKHYADAREARAGISQWFAFYNTGRPHQAHGYRTPMSVWREGVIGAFGEKAVDMWTTHPYRAQHLLALPTCPQPQQQQARAA
jgi:putative transposase